MMGADNRNIGVARLSGLLVDLNLTSKQFSNASMSTFTVLVAPRHSYCCTNNQSFLSVMSHSKSHQIWFSRNSNRQDGFQLR
jgi:hypothetical protein